MSVLLLRLCAPMQAWGIQSRFGVRDTAREPSKSGVIGLLAATQGRPRDAAIDDLAVLRMGVRVDREGTLLRDYHTAQDVYRAKGGIKPTELSTRYYLSDACFLVGLEGGVTLLTELHAALRDPVWSLYLGRRAFTPGEPPWLADGLREGDLLETLATYPWLKGEPKTSPLVRMVIEDRSGDEVRPDQPLSFAPHRYAPRRVMHEYRRVDVQESISQ
jgi:CRISPR system Cascade subunit CasD